MRKFAFAVIAASLFLLPTLSSAKAANCQELRLACEHRDSLGEQGAGNCQKYRASCERHPSCSQLRYQCLHKDAYRGGEGAGFCQTYRETCR
jgi:hypothetical protein